MPPLTDPKAIAELGEKIYATKYKQEFEQKYGRKFVAIDVNTEKAYIADTPEKALDDAKNDSPRGLFHLIQVGYTGAFRVSYTSHGNVDWVFR